MEKGNWMKVSDAENRTTLQISQEEFLKYIPLLDRDGAEFSFLRVAFLFNRFWKKNIFSLFSLYKYSKKVAM